MGIISGEIIVIGSELLIGNRPETNSGFLAESLAGRGVQVRWKTIVGDVHGDIADALEQAARRAQVVILTGGLGSTVDDCTREVIARVTSRPLRRRKKAIDRLRAQYASRGWAVTAALSRQASIPSGAEMLENPVGSAFGFLLKWQGSVIVALPGVSREAKAMFEEHVVPRLERYLKQTHVMSQRVFHTFGLPESAIDERLKPVMRGVPSVKLGLLPSTQGVTVTLTLWHAVGSQKDTRPGDHSLDLLRRTASLVRHRLGKYLYAEDKQTMEEVVGQYLSAHGLTLAVAESCTGGLIGHRLTQVPGSSGYLDRVLVCYSNQAKQELLGVSKYLLGRYGAVSSQVVRAMARGARTRGQTDVGLGITGIAGPGGGSKQKPVGLVFVGIDGPGGARTWKFHFHGDRQAIKSRASQAALDALRRYILRKFER